MSRDFRANRLLKRLTAGLSVSYAMVAGSMLAVRHPARVRSLVLAAGFARPDPVLLRKAAQASAAIHALSVPKAPTIAVKV